MSFPSRILAIGNSFSEDATEHLWHICHSAGHEVTIGDLVIGGCPLSRHLDNARGDHPAYEYYYITNGTWIKTPGHKLAATLMGEPWDVVTLQQVSQDAGRPDTFDTLDELIERVRICLPETCRLYWHMTWAYQADSNHPCFPNYNGDQMTMHRAITATVTSQILHRKDFSGILPSGTAIQNLRTSHLGDNLTRDGFHLSLDIGRYTAALAWFAALGGDVDAVSWTPNDAVAEALPAIREAVKAAVSYPMEITAVGAR